MINGNLAHHLTWRQWVVTITSGVIVVFFGFMLARIDNKNIVINDNIKLLEKQQVRTQEMLRIEYEATDHALLVMFKSEYEELKSLKQKKLMDKYKFKKGE